MSSTKIYFIVKHKHFHKKKIKKKTMFFLLFRVLIYREGMVFLMILFEHLKNVHSHTNTYHAQLF